MKSLKKLEKFETNKLEKSPFTKVKGGAGGSWTIESSYRDFIADADC